MRVYVTYFRYDRGESYSIYHIDTSMRNSIKHWKEEDLPNFLGYGPDDVSQLYLVRCDLTKTEVEVLKDSMTSGTDYDVEFTNLIDSIHRDMGNDDIIYYTTGDENFEVLQWFQEHFRWFINPLDYWETEDDIPTDEDELNYELQQILSDDEPVFDLVLKRYISRHTITNIKMTGFQKGVRSFYIEKIIKVCAVHLFTNDPNCGIIYM